jgi:hypothetical protein
MTLSAPSGRVDLVAVRRTKAGGPPFKMVLIFRVAAPSRFFEGAEGFFVSNEFVSDET